MWLQIFTLVAVIIIIGLLLRYGKSSIGLGKLGVSGATSLANDLTLKGSGYQYYGP